MVGVDIQGEEGLLPMEESLEELAVLALTAGLEVVGQATQQVNAPNPKTMIGKGKVEEVKALADELAASVILFDRSEEHTSELQSLMRNSYAVLCLKKKK